MKVRWQSVSMIAALTVIVGISSIAVSPAFASEEYSSAGTFGSEGSGEGQFNTPNAIAVNESNEPLTQSTAGDVYVVDSGNSRVERFSATGEYLSQWNGSATEAKSFSLEGPPRGIAVDSSNNPMDPSAGDVYVADGGTHVVIDQFNGEGVFTGLELNGTCSAPGTCPGKVIPFSSDGFGETEIVGIAVDAHGDLWMIEQSGTVDEFSDTGAFVQELKLKVHSPKWLQVDSSGDLFTLVQTFNNSGGQIQPVVEFSDSEEVAQFGTGAYSFGVDPVSGEVFADASLAIERFALVEGKPHLEESFGSEELAESYAMAVNGSSPQKTVYAVERDVGKVEIFNYGLFPRPVTGAASEASETGMELQGTVNPEGDALTACRFEYGTTSSYGQSIPCQQSLSAIGEGASPVFVSAKLSGLPASSIRHFRLAVANANGTKYGQDVSVSTPTLEDISTSSVGPSEATIGVQIGPGGSPTTYRVEYGTSDSYGSLTPEVKIGAGEETTSVQVRLSGLQPETSYHARFVASNEIGKVMSADLAFTTVATSGGSTSSLPDDRAYELVSTANNTDIYAPDARNGGKKGQIDTSRPFRASPEGNEITYLAEPPPVGGSGSQGLGEQFLAKRTGSGWTAADIVPPGAATETEYQAFSSDLSIGILVRGGLDNAETANAAECDDLITESEGGRLHPFFTEQRPVGSCGGSQAAPYFAGASADYSHLLLESKAALIEGAEEAVESQGYNLYDSVDGHLQLVNVLPGPDPTPDPNATFGGSHGILGNEGNPPAFSNVISADGTRVFWTDRNTRDLYLRLDGQTTVPISAGESRFWTASPDGRYVFYTEEERLWRFDVDKLLESNKPEAEALTEAREPLTGEAAGVEGVIGINETGEDGRYVYFVAAGVLAGNEDANKERAMEGSPNLYVRVGNETRFIATLSPGDNALGGPLENVQIEIGDWMHNLGDRTAEVTPDGQAVGFLSHASLTGYDNKNIVEAYVYDASTGQLSCASCSPSGAPAVSEVLVPTTDTGNGNVYMERWLSDDGSRVFFETEDPLLPLASDGRMNVYEWERAGFGTCGESAGCIYLLSGGGSSEDSFLVDASADGSNVFFTSRENFVPAARGEAIKLYDARVDGGFFESATSCTGSGCQGVPPAPPIFATPSSVTFNGVGDLEAPVSKRAPSSKRKTAAETRAERLAKALKACRKKLKHRREQCLKQARKKYAPVLKKGKR